LRLCVNIRNIYISILVDMIFVSYFLSGFNIWSIRKLLLGFMSIYGSQDTSRFRIMNGLQHLVWISYICRFAFLHWVSLNDRFISYCWASIKRWFISYCWVSECNWFAFTIWTSSQSFVGFHTTCDSQSIYGFHDKYGS